MQQNDSLADGYCQDPGCVDINCGPGWRAAPQRSPPGLDPAAVSWIQPVRFLTRVARPCPRHRAGGPKQRARVLSHPVRAPQVTIAAPSPPPPPRPAGVLRRGPSRSGAGPRMVGWRPFARH